MDMISWIIVWTSFFPITGAEFASLCYFTNWASSRPVASVRFSINNIDPYLCSHLIYAFANIAQNDNAIVPMSVGEEERYKQFNKLKDSNKKLKTLISVGGQNAKSKQFSAISSKAVNIEQFAKSVTKFLRSHGFDGMDVDWEYPGEIEGTKEQFTALLRGIRQEFDREAKESGKERLLLTIAVPAGEKRINEGFEVEKISLYVDYINIMAYDYFGSWNKIAGFNSPLNPRKSDPRFSEQLNQKWTVNKWLRMKAPRSKIVVGMTGAGCSFTLNDTSNTAVGAPVDGGGTKGHLYLLEGRLVYPEICTMIKDGAQEEFDQEQFVPYVYKDDQWVGYDNAKSIKAKVEWMISEGFAGAMFWSLDFDDFSGKFCGAGKFPLLTAMKNEITKATTQVYPVPTREVVDSGKDNGNSSCIIYWSMFLRMLIFVMVFQTWTK